MKRTLIATTSALCLLGIGLFGILNSQVHGEDSLITDAQIQAIKLRCTDIQATLSRLHQNDALLRANRGGVYREISDKLMVPLNQRIAANQLNSGDLIKIAADYKDAYQDFYNAFQTYDNALSDAMDTDCTKQPTTFYSQLEDAHQKRLALHASSQKLLNLAASYKTTFDQIKPQLAKDQHE